MTHVEDVLLWAISDTGAEYVFGAETTVRDDHPHKIDCSELVEWSCAKAGVTPTVPDGSYNQFAFCQAHNLAITVDKAVHTRGALMFITESNGLIGHVVFSLGDGTTMEAKGKAYGVGTFSAFSTTGRVRFDKAALIPGCDYSPRQPLPAKEPDVFQPYLVDIPAPDAAHHGIQIAGHDVDGHHFGVYRDNVVVSVRADDNGQHVPVGVQPYGYGGDLALSFFGLDGGVAPQRRVIVTLGRPG